jgi:hypothetical protein
MMGVWLIFIDLSKGGGLVRDDLVVILCANAYSSRLLRRDRGLSWERSDLKKSRHLHAKA